MLETMSMVDFVMFRLEGALHEPWIEDMSQLERAVVAGRGRVEFSDLREVVAQLIPIWEFVREYVRYTGPQQIKNEVHRVSLVFHNNGVRFEIFYFVCSSVSALPLGS